MKKLLLQTASDNLKNDARVVITLKKLVWWGWSWQYKKIFGDIVLFKCFYTIHNIFLQRSRIRLDHLFRHCMSNIHNNIIIPIMRILHQQSKQMIVSINCNCVFVSLNVNTFTMPYHLPLTLPLTLRPNRLD